MASKTWADYFGIPKGGTHLTAEEPSWTEFFDPSYLRGQTRNAYDFLYNIASMLPGPEEKLASLAIPAIGMVKSRMLKGAPAGAEDLIRPFLNRVPQSIFDPIRGTKIQNPEKFTEVLSKISGKELSQLPGVKGYATRPISQGVNLRGIQNPQGPERFERQVRFKKGMTPEEYAYSAPHEVGHEIVYTELAENPKGPLAKYGETREGQEALADTFANLTGQVAPIWAGDRIKRAEMFFPGIEADVRAFAKRQGIKVHEWDELIKTGTKRYVRPKQGKDWVDFLEDPTQKIPPSLRTRPTSDFTRGDFVTFQAPDGRILNGKIRDVDSYSKEAWIFSEDRSIHDAGDSITIPLSKVVKK